MINISFSRRFFILIVAAGVACFPKQDGPRELFQKHRDFVEALGEHRSPRPHAEEIEEIERVLAVPANDEFLLQQLRNQSDPYAQEAALYLLESYNQKLMKEELPRIVLTGKSEVIPTAAHYLAKYEPKTAAHTFKKLIEDDSKLSSMYSVVIMSRELPSGDKRMIGNSLTLRIQQLRKSNSASDKELANKLGHAARIASVPLKD